MATRTRTRYVAFTLLMVFVSVGLAFAAGELGLRGYQYARRDQRLIVNHDTLHHALRPNLDVIDRTHERPYRFVTNEKGWPEEDNVEPNKPSNTFRVFYVGDSNTQGLVGPKRKMATLVEQKLNRFCGNSSLNFDIVNTGTSSYSTYIYYLLVRDEILSLSPDLVVINIDMTDIPNDLMYRNFSVHDGNGELSAIVDFSETNKFSYALAPTGVIKVSKRAPLFIWLVDRTATGYYVDKLIARYRWNSSFRPHGYQIDETANWLAKEWSPEIVANVADSLSILRQLIDLLKTHGIRVALTSVPHLPQFKGEWSARPHAVLGDLAAREKIPFLDGFAAVRTQVDEDALAELYWATDNTHFNVAGNELWAELQFDFLTDPSAGPLPTTVCKVEQSTAK